MSATQNFRVAGFVTGLAIKAPCLVATIVNITLSALQTVDSVVLTAGDRVLVKEQTDPIENGIYTAETSAWKRDGDFDGNRDIVKGTLVSVVRSNGAAGVNQHYKVETANPITIDTTGITFSRADGAGITTVGDKNTALSVHTSKRTLIMNAELTANRVVTLNTTNAVDGDDFRIVRTGLGSFTYDVGGLKTIPSATAAFVDVEFDGTAWFLTGYGLL